MERNPYVEAGKIITISQLEQAACKIWEVPIERLYEKRRFPEVVEPRQVVFFFRKKFMKHSPYRIKKETGFHHATVYHAEKKVSGFLEVDPLFKKRYRHFIDLLMKEVG